MINNSSDPAGSPVMRTVYIRASTQTSAIVPPATDSASSTSPDDGVISMVSRPSASSPTGARLMAIDGGDRSDASMEVFAWQTAQAMLADPMQAKRSQGAPGAESVSGLLGNRFG
ncbi:MAG: hypothetical protein KYX66_14190 [Blastomonas fulva]|uniref:hypothetical protein n=1 Tax=Blastomonas fulva TaxID=1550728 RepID=UPI0024E1EF35|nr:hypothetical protein [Blastomonas fulva]MDK2757871.1 hypothetical protein [Blastomonas fulva]